MHFLFAAVRWSSSLEGPKIYGDRMLAHIFVLAIRPTNTTRSQRTNCQPLSMFVRCIIGTQNIIVMVPNIPDIVCVTLLVIYIYALFTDAPLIFSNFFFKLSSVIFKLIHTLTLSNICWENPYNVIVINNVGMNK